MKNCTGGSFVVTDLPTLPFHYASYKFRQCSNVRPIPLRLKDDFQLKTDLSFDVIFCCQVFEHLNNPLQTVRTFHQILKPDGLLVFDYLISEAKDLDTKQGLEYRNEVFAFLERRFSVEKGKLDRDKSMGLTVVRKI